MIRKNYNFQSGLRTYLCLKIYVANKKFQTTTRVTVVVCRQQLKIAVSTQQTTAVDKQQLCCLSTTQLMSQIKTRVTIVSQPYNLRVEQHFVSLLFFVNGTTYVSNNSCTCCCLSTTQLMCRTNHVTVRTNHVTVIVCQQHNSLFQTTPRIMLCRFCSIFEPCPKNVCVKQQCRTITRVMYSLISATCFLSICLN